jgi:quinohemoprotein ethanol dehydrogenase
MSYNPETGYFFVPGTIPTSAFARYGDQYKKGKQYNGGTQAAPIGSEMSGTWTAITGNTNKISWQKDVPYRVGSGGGSMTTAGGLAFHGDPGGNIQARDAKTGELLWQFQTGYGVEAPPMVYEVDGDEYGAVAAGGNQGIGSANGDAVWTFSLKGQVNRLWPPPPPPRVAGPQTGPIAEGVDAVKIGDNNIEFGYFPKRTRVKAGTEITFTNAGDTPHTATSFDNGKNRGLGHGGAEFGRIEDDHLRQAGQLLLHLHAASLDVRPDHRRITAECQAGVMRPPAR